MKYAPPEKNEPWSAVILDVFERLWQTKLKSVILLERWLKETTDVEIRAGLEAQLMDERRNSRLLAEAIRQRGARPGSGHGAGVLNRPFIEAGALKTDLHRLCAFHRGIKAFTLNRCGHLILIVEPRLALLLEQIAREEERHIRWADIRISRLLTYEEMRQCNLLMGRIWASMESPWEKPWRELARAQRRLA